MLTLLWDILCPSCRIPSSVKDTLQSLKEHEYCEACNLDFESNFSTSVELIFRIHPELRRVKTETYCIGGPAHFPHIVAQTRIRSGERVKWTLGIPPGSYRLRSPHLAWTLDFQVAQKGGVGRWELPLGGPQPETPSPLNSDHQNLVLHNTAEQELLVRLERVVGRDDALTAAQASSLATFRELFPNEVMAPGQLANVTRVTLLAVSVGQLDEVYSERGDSGTFAIVHECLRIADEAVQAEGGAVIRIIADGFLAAFEDPIGATQVALKLPSLIAQSESVRMPTRIALHRGDAMLTTINGRLDYFGMTVNTVFDLLESTEFGDLSITQAVSGDPAVATILQENDRHCEFVQSQRVGDRQEPVLRLSVLEL
jgi:class 3 adenylate cyclase